MARDLIPPLSPAGRPRRTASPTARRRYAEPDRAAARAAALARAAGPGAAAGAVGVPQPLRLPARRAGRRLHRRRAGARRGRDARAAATASTRVSRRTGRAWQPSDTSLEGGAAADRRRRSARSTGTPTASSSSLVTGAPLDARRRAARRLGPITVIDDPGVLYRLDGLGPNGSILGGKASAARLKLVHREALELALYTFRYLPDVKQVVTLLPSPPPTKSRSATTPPRRRRCGAGRVARPTDREAADIAAAQAAIAGHKASTTHPDPVERGLLPPRRPQAAAADAARTDASRQGADARDAERRGSGDDRPADAVERVQVVAAETPDSAALLVLDR